MIDHALNDITFSEQLRFLEKHDHTYLPGYTYVNKI